MSGLVNVADYNREAWNRQARAGSRWSIPVSTELIALARNGDFSFFITPNRPVPTNWLPTLDGAQVLCLASGGGQQAPLLAAAGARVTSFDNSDEQLARDRQVAEREGLEIKLIRGDMRDLSCLDDDHFDLIVNAVSNMFIPDVQPVWQECVRVLRPGGALLASFMNPHYFLFDHEEAKVTSSLKVEYTLPYSDLTSPSEAKREELRKKGQVLEFGHSLEAQITGQLHAGLRLEDLFEDYWADEATPLNKYCPTHIATRSVLPLS